MSKKIYINPGHSNVDPGAVGYETERELNVKTAQYMNDHLLAKYDCQTKVTDGKINSVSQVAADANQWGADLLVSIHNNAGGGDGYEALVYSEARKPMGRIFEKYVKAAGQNSRGVKLRPDLGVLRLSNMPAVLNEGAFVDNKKDIQDWNDDAELKKLGVAYAEAAAEYLDLPKKSAEPVKPTEPVPAKTFIIKLPILSKGCEGEPVKALQLLLIGRGYSCGKWGADGDYGAATVAAVREYQAAEKLPVNGAADAATMSSLLGV